ncbi:MAG: hypothetical protein ACXWD8_01480, partial [Mycobacterium sp.]
MDNMWDCFIVGGGAAGLSAGLVLGRARRRTLLVDAGAQSNLAAHGIGGLIGHDGENPIAVDGFYRTTAAGVFAAGDLSVQMPKVATAIA